MKTIGVLFGGKSSEYPVSLQSAYGVLSHMDQTKFTPVPIGITKEGQWFRFTGDMARIESDTWHEDSSALFPLAFTIGGFLEQSSKGDWQFITLDAVFPVLHGKNGEDGTVQGMLELAGIPIIGCGTLSSALCMDKFRAHTLVEAAGIEIPKAVVLKQLSLNMTALNGLCYPLFVKPVRAGSSFGITKVTTPIQLVPAIAVAFQHDSEVIVEEAVDGFEVGCAILGTEKPLLGRVDEIELADGFFDYTEKYILKSSRIHMPARIDEATEKRVRQAALTIYQTLGCVGFARVDMFLTPDKRIVFNEVNTIPGFTPHSRFPNMLGGIGLSFSEVITQAIEMSVMNHEPMGEKDHRASVGY